MGLLPPNEIVARADLNHRETERILSILEPRPLKRWAVMGVSLQGPGVFAPSLLKVYRAADIAFPVHEIDDLVNPALRARMRRRTDYVSHFRPLARLVVVRA